MNRDRDKGAKSGATRCQKPLRAQHQHQHQHHHQVQTQRRRKEPAPKDALSDTSNSSEDLSKDSGCLSGKLSSSDSSSEVSDCPSEGNKQDSPSCEISWIDGAAYVSPEGDRAAGSEAAAPPAAAAAAAGGGLAHSAGSYLDHLMMGDTAEDLVREVDDLRSENEYLKDEVEELRCEMLEMRDMFQEEEVYQLQELRLQLEQANKTCRILQYRLRKAERRSIRVAQTGQVDGELVRGLEHDIRVAKSVSLRLYSELELVQKKNAQLEWENEALREKTQELEVARQVLKAEVEKARESTVKKKSIRSSSSKAEKRLSQQIEDDSADLRCQLHFAKEELALMCKKLTKLVSESEAMREELAKYHSAYGDIDATQSPEGKQNSAHAREAEVKVHLKLVEEEATLLSRRIVELEVENRGLRAEMSDLREKVGRGGGGEEEEEEENRDVLEENPVKETAGGGLKVECMVHEQVAGKNKGEMETSLLCSQSQAEGTMAACHITREGPVGGEWNPSDSPERENNINLDTGLKGMMMKDYESLQALRDHSCILSSAIQLLTATPKNGHCSSPSCTLSSPTDGDLNGKSQKISVPGPLSEALELLQAMLLSFIGRVEALLTEDDFGKLSAHKDGHVWDQDADARSKQECAEDLRTTEVKERDKQMRKPSSFPKDLVHNCRDSKVRLCFQILGILHQWCEVKGPGLEGNEGKDKALLVLRGLLQDLGAELRDERIEFDREAKNTQSKAAECAVNSVLHDEHRSEADRTRSMTEKRRRAFSPHGRTKNWCYVSQEAAQLDREDPVKTWDHLIMPLSFPHLDFEQMSLERSHTAPERSSVRIYYSPPSARRVQLAQPKQSSEVEERERESVNTTPPWCTPPTSFSSLRLLGSAGNLSEDAVEVASGSWRPERKGRSQGRWVEMDMSCSGTHNLTRPQMVSVGLQTEGAPPVRGSPSRTSLVSARSHHISTSLEGVPGRVERSRASTSSPKLYRRHSTSGAASPPASANLSSSSSSSSTSSKDRALWNLNHHSHSGLSWTRQTSHRAGGAVQSHSSTKPPSKPGGGNRYGAVTEFLRRVSGRAERPVSVPVLGQKTKSGLKTLERVPTRPPSAPLHRNDSVTRIVNQRFMRQREERGSSGSSGSSGSHGVRQSPSSSTAEDRNYDCSSSSSLTFCFARSSRSAHRPASNQGKLQRHRESPPARAAAASQT